MVRVFSKGDIDIDHIIPQNYGGSDNLNNLQCMCKHCNRSKQDDLNHVVSNYANNTVKNRSWKKKGCLIDNRY
ncbi:MAG: HNH endonuclease [Clostridium sp.]|nr:HNH endonuclease [Clostridium sp.]